MGILKNSIFIGIILSILGFFLLIQSPQQKKEIEKWKTKYTELLNSKQDTVTKYDTVTSERIVIRNKFIPVKTVDTVYMHNTVSSNWYFEQHKDSLIHADFSIVVFGELRHFDFQYTVFPKTEYITSVVYRDRIEFQPERALYLNGAISSDLSLFNFNLSYHTKKKISFSTGLLLDGESYFWMLGIGYRIF